jgi:hypothetical protein
VDGAGQDSPEIVGEAEVLGAGCLADSPVKVGVQADGDQPGPSPWGHSQGRGRRSASAPLPQPLPGAEVGGVGGGPPSLQVGLGRAGLGTMADVAPGLPGVHVGLELVAAGDGGGALDVDLAGDDRARGGTGSTSVWAWAGVTTTSVMGSSPTDRRRERLDRGGGRPES